MMTMHIYSFYICLYINVYRQRRLLMQPFYMHNCTNFCQVMNENLNFHKILFVARSLSIAQTYFRRCFPAHCCCGKLCALFQNHNNTLLAYIYMAIIIEHNKHIYKVYTTRRKVSLKYKFLPHCKMLIYD